MKCHIKAELSKQDLASLIRLKSNEEGQTPFTYPSEEDAARMDVAVTTNGITLTWTEEVRL